VAGGNPPPRHPARSTGTSPAAWTALGAALLHAGRTGEAIPLLRQAVATQPDCHEAHNSLGVALHAAGELDEALVRLHRAVKLKPQFAEAHYNLGNALRDYGRLEEALLCYCNALDCKPALAIAHLNMGNVLRLLGRAPEALACYARALELEPAMADAWNNMGTACKELGQDEEATRLYAKALELAPDSPIANYNLANMLKEQYRWAEAGRLFEKAVRLQPGFAEAHNNLGLALKDQGQLEEAVASFRAALSVRPEYLAPRSNLLMTLNYMDDVSPQTIYEEHKAFGLRHATGLEGALGPLANHPDPRRRLRVGYVSPDFRNHACAFFLEPLLAHHDRGAFEIHAYAEVARPDAVTQRLSRHIDQWHSTVGINDDDVAAQIRRDGIDVLVDLAGHTSQNRLLVFARRPAPVQMTWLGYPATTGLPAMDYRLTDGYTDPVGETDRYYTETLVRLPHSLWCYHPPEDMPEVTALPAIGNGYLTFGSFNHFAKIGPRVIALWAELLRALPDARLVMISVAEGDAQTHARRQFSELGIEPERVELHGRLARADYLATYQHVDLALDPFPCNGGTTTCDALWMGVPIITLIGNTFLSRAGYSLLNSAGLAQFAARSAGEYVRIAAECAADLQSLAGIRAAMRERLRVSPLLDGVQFARDVERAYRDLWRQWCGTREARAAADAESAPENSAGSA
jgi:predicted O-linked N-acetylglucosamine transferase (SPINDLY family)